MQILNDTIGKYSYVNENIQMKTIFDSNNKKIHSIISNYDQNHIVSKYKSDVYNLNLKIVKYEKLINNYENEKRVYNQNLITMNNFIDNLKKNYSYINILNIMKIDQNESYSYINKKIKNKNLKEKHIESYNSPKININKVLSTSEISRINFEKGFNINSNNIDNTQETNNNFSLINDKTISDERIVSDLTEDISDQNDIKNNNPMSDVKTKSDENIISPKSLKDKLISKLKSNSSLSVNRMKSYINSHIKDSFKDKNTVFENIELKKKYNFYSNYKNSIINKVSNINENNLKPESIKRNITSPNSSYRIMNNNYNQKSFQSSDMRSNNNKKYIKSNYSDRNVSKSNSKSIELEIKRTFNTNIKYRDNKIQNVKLPNNNIEINTMIYRDYGRHDNEYKDYTIKDDSTQLFSIDIYSNKDSEIKYDTTNINEVNKDNFFINRNQFNSYKEISNMDSLISQESIIIDNPQSPKFENMNYDQMINQNNDLELQSPECETSNINDKVNNYEDIVNDYEFSSPEQDEDINNNESNKNREDSDLKSPKSKIFDMISNLEILNKKTKSSNYFIKNNLKKNLSKNRSLKNVNYQKLYVKSENE